MNLYSTPWDGLRLYRGKDIDPIDVTHHYLKLYKGHGYSKKWRANFDKNMLFVSDYESIVKKFSDYERILKQRKTLDISFHYYTFGLVEEFEQYANSVSHYHPYLNSFEDFIKDLNTYMNFLDGYRKGLGQSENNVYPVQMIFFPVNFENSEKIRQSKEIREVLKRTVEQYVNRFIVVPVFEDTFNLPAVFFDLFPNVFYVTEKSRKTMSEKFYPDTQIFKNSWYYKTVCYYMDKRYNAIRPLHDYKGELTDWGKEQILSRETEKKLYKEFLDSLSE